MSKSVTKKMMLRRLALMNPELPGEILRAALDLLIRQLIRATAEERPVILRGFGRLWIRRYRPKAGGFGRGKEIGCLFRPSPALSRRISPVSGEAGSPGPFPPAGG